MSNEGFRKRIHDFFRSMKLRIFLIVMITGCIVGGVIFFTAYKAVSRESIADRIEEVRGYAASLTERMNENVFTVYPEQAADITRELGTLADVYGGRIIVTNAVLKIVYDSYGIEVGKTLVSEEAIRGYHGEESIYRNNEAHYIEMAFPIKDETGTDNETNAAPKSVFRGNLIIRFSTEKSFKLVHRLLTRLVIAVIILGIVLIFVAVISSNIFIKPFSRITQSLKHVSEGYIEDKVDIGGYTEMDIISDSFNDMLNRISIIEDSRQEFVSNVSHELKTPMTSIKVLADYLASQDEVPNELYKEFMTDINAEIDRENKIINDLLELVKLDRKSGDMHIADVSINELLEHALNRLKPIAGAASVKLVLESYRYVIAEVDEVKLSLAVTNLVENGIKYNRENGSVRVLLNSDHNSFTIIVEDTGIGIPQSELDKIFDRFYRVDKMRSRQTGGTGLGLSICKSIVLMHHGSIKVESEEGSGTKFTIRIPLSYIPEV